MTADKTYKKQVLWPQVARLDIMTNTTSYINVNV